MRIPVMGEVTEIRVAYGDKVWHDPAYPGVQFQGPPLTATSRGAAGTEPSAPHEAVRPSVRIYAMGPTPAVHDQREVSAGSGIKAHTVEALTPEEIVNPGGSVANDSVTAREPGRLPLGVRSAMRQIRAAYDNLFDQHEALVREVFRHQAPESTPEWLPLEDAAQRYGLAPKTLRNHASNERLRHGYHFTRRGGKGRGKLFFHAAHMDEFMFEGHNGIPVAAVRRRNRRG